MERMNLLFLGKMPDSYEWSDGDKDAIEDALKALDIDFKFFSVWSSGTVPSFSQDLKNPFCIVQNEQVFLYLEHCVWCYNEEENCGPKNWGNHHPVSFEFFLEIHFMKIFSEL